MVYLLLACVVIVGVLKVGYILFKVAMCPMTIKMPYGEEDLPDLKASFLMCVFVVNTC